MRNLSVIGNEAWTLMREGEAEKQVFINYTIYVQTFKIVSMMLVNLSLFIFI